MNIKEYAEISKNVEVPDVVTERFEATINKIKAETEWQGKDKPHFDKIVKFAAIAAAIILFFGTATLSVRAYIRHIHAIRNMPGEQAIALYESVYKYNSGMLSRELSEEEEKREAELFLAYSNDTAEPKSEVKIIERKEEYKGKGGVFCKEDGILYIPDKTLSDEEQLECIEFSLIGHYIVSEGYELATNSDHYMNALKSLSDSQIDDIYVSYAMAGTECAFLSRDLSVDETARRKALKKLYMYTDKKPVKEIAVISKSEDYTGNGVAFCTYDCTYYLPETDLTDEDLLEYIDYTEKQYYAVTRIAQDIESGLILEGPHVEYVSRERVETLDNVSLKDEDILSSEWLKAYSKIGEDYFLSVHAELDPFFAANDELSEEEEGKLYADYYFSVCFIYLNDDDIPEMLLTRGYTPMDSVNDLSDRRVFLYTVKDGKAVQLKSEYGETEGFYAQSSPFRYAERKGMVLSEGHNDYQFFFDEVSNDNHDHINDSITRMDYWDLDSLTCKHTDLNIKLEHAVYNEFNKETYNDAEKTYEYYLGVKEITRDEYTGVVDPLNGRKVNEAEFNAANEALWNGEAYRTLTVSDFDKIYNDYDIPESLAKCYQKQLGNK